MTLPRATAESMVMSNTRYDFKISKPPVTQCVTSQDNMWYTCWNLKLPCFLPLQQLHTCIQLLFSVSHKVRTRVVQGSEELWCSLGQLDVQRSCAFWPEKHQSLWIMVLGKVKEWSRQTAKVHRSLQDQEPILGCGGDIVRQRVWDWVK